MRTNNYLKYPQFPDEREAGGTPLKQLNIVLFRLLRIFNFICEKYNIDYWLDYGTLLGAIRHQGFIPWDYDIDIGMLREDYNLFIEKGVKDLPFDIFFQNRDSDPNIGEWGFIVEGRLRDRFSNNIGAQKSKSSSTNWHNGIQLDIFVYDYDSKNGWFSNGFERILSQSRIYLKLEEIEYLDTASFEGHEFPIPIGYDSYLKRCYGDYMKLPSIEEQEKLPDIDIFNSCDHPESLIWKEFHPTKIKTSE
ncbi:LicD family protein [Dysgonomonas termitidis]|uniref:Phosphorylcholine transferase LicD n=1 Tax=Dysgonomonas termitidis TaxID=1516126 RepID=A0ABV9KYI8_9BACT